MATILTSSQQTFVDITDQRKLLVERWWLNRHIPFSLIM